MNSWGRNSHSKSGVLELKLLVRYQGLKATQYFSKYTSESDSAFREDLSQLKLPLPKRSNTTFVSHGFVQCSWPAVQKNGAFHRHIQRTLEPAEPEQEHTWNERLKELSINSIFSREIYPAKSKKEKRAKELAACGTYRFDPIITRSQTQNSHIETNPYSPVKDKDHPPTSSVQERILGKRRFEEAFSDSPPTGEKRVSSSKSGLSASAGPSALKIAAAEALLDEIKNSNRPNKIPKAEPMDLLLPFVGTRRSSDSSSSASTSGPPAKLPPTGPRLQAQAKPSQVNLSSTSSSSISKTPDAAALEAAVQISSRDAISTTMANQSTLEHLGVNDSRRISPQSAMQVSSSSASLLAASRQTLQPVILPFPTSSACSGTSSIGAILAQLQSLLPNPVPPSGLSVSETSTPLSPTITKIPPELVPRMPDSLNLRRLDSNNVPTIQRLTRESYDVRNQITANLARDAAIVAELKELQAAFVPGPFKISSSSGESVAISEMKAQMQIMQQELEQERTLRNEADRVIKDIQREYKAPFVVPGLLDAFMQISKLTTQASRLAMKASKEPTGV
ncbi:hypothetical protein B0H34DRAFT_525943 [Crassisporium funariophilum]|nr:hypothetical protein B0H34DRAFT_525943 [Crassisporium funariophilum]